MMDKAVAVPDERGPLLQDLRSALQQAGKGRGAIVLVTGEEGTGKVTLVETALAAESFPAARVHLVRVEPADQYRPFQALSPLVRASMELARPRAGESMPSLFLSPFLTAPPPPRGTHRGGRPRPSSATLDWTPPVSTKEESYRRLLADLAFYKRGVEAWGDRSRFLREVGEAVLDLAEGEPTAVLIRGAQNMDPHSWSVIRYMTERLADTPLVLFLTVSLSSHAPMPAPARELLLAPRVQHVQVAPLSVSGVRYLLERSVQKRALTPQFVELVHRASRGLPSIVAQLAQGEELELPGTGARPGDVSAMARERIRLLPPNERDLLRRLSLLGGGFSVDDAAIILGTEVGAVASRLKPLVEAGFLHAEGDRKYAFHVAALPAVLREELPLDLRQQLHRRLAESIGAAGHLAGPLRFTLADAWWEAGAWEEAAKANLEAARSASDAYAPDSALKYASRAKEAMGHLTKEDVVLRGEVLAELGRAQYDLGRLKDSRKNLEDALKLLGKKAPDWPLRARTLFLLARTLGALGQGRRALDLVREANEAIGTVEDVRAQMMLQQVVGVAFMMNGHDKAASVHFREMLRLADQLKDERERSYALKNLSAVLLSLDPHDKEGMAAVDEALAYHEKTKNYAGMAAGYLNRSFTWLSLGDPEKALSDLARSRQAGENAHAPSLVCSAALSEASIHLDRGVAPKAANALRALEPWIGAMEEPYARVGYLMLLGRLAQLEGKHELAHRDYQRALHEAEVQESPADIWEAHARLALLAAGQGDLDELRVHRQALPSISEAQSSAPGVVDLLKEVEGKSKSAA